MKKVFLFLIGCCGPVLFSYSQNITQKLQNAFQQFENDNQLKHAISSLYVINAKTGQVVFDKNSQVGLAGASTQKIIIAAAAFELLKKDYRYKTEIALLVPRQAPYLKELTVSGFCDPTFGSWRYASTKEDAILSNIVNAIKAKGIKNINAPVTARVNLFDSQQIPGGWIWDDIANYYGAGAAAINWKENQYDLWLKPGAKTGDSVVVLQTIPQQDIGFHNELKTGKAMSGDNAYIYFNPTERMLTLKGTIPCCVDSFKISGAVTEPGMEFLQAFQKALTKAGITTINTAMYTASKADAMKVEETYYTHYSPTLDSIIYWYLKKSINLYGEALVKTFAFEKQGIGSTDTGVAIVRKFWKEKGIDEEELNIYDGSGLSPMNRITTHAQVEILKYARNRDWFSYFYDALPEYNGMKMKSGTIGDVKGFSGYQKAKDGTEYIFSFLVNNYNGKTSGIVNKMYKVLDELK